MPPQIKKSSTGEEPVRARGEYVEPQKPITDPQTQLNPDPVYYKEVDVSDLPSKYTEDIETFGQILNIPDPRDNMPVSSTSV